MRQRFEYAIPVILLWLLAACQGPAEPPRRELLGSWKSLDLPTTTIRMTLAPTGRTVEGAGSWANETRALPFRVFGALAGSDVSLYFDFDDREDIGFQGVFGTADQVVGVIGGGEYRDQAVTFVREPLPR